MSPTIYIIVTSWWLSRKTAEKNIFFLGPSPREILNVDHFLNGEAVFIQKGENSHSLKQPLHSPGESSNAIVKWNHFGGVPGALTRHNAKTK